MPKPYYPTVDSKKAAKKPKEPATHIKRRGSGINYIVLNYESREEVNIFKSDRKLSHAGIEGLLHTLPADLYLVQEKKDRTGKILRRFLYQNGRLENKF